jgi:oxygen-independent coproporphyrinogen-3 oxidase
VSDAAPAAAADLAPAIAAPGCRTGQAPIVGHGQPPGQASQPGDAPHVGQTPEAARPMPPVGLYIHIPFCLSLCPYCDFVVLTGRSARGPSARLEAFTEALLTELELRADEFDAAHGAPGTGSPPRPPLASVYLGGGTPSLLAPAVVATLLARAGDRFRLAPDAEVTLEANPGPADRGDLAGFRAAGVTRLSVGAQSLSADELRRLGRRHRPADVADAVAEARAAGFASVSLDLLTDIPDQSIEDWLRTLNAAIDLGPDHLSTYALTLDVTPDISGATRDSNAPGPDADPGAEAVLAPEPDHLPIRPGALRWRCRARAHQDEDRAADMDALTDAVLGPAGFHRYEISNHARRGHESRHNRAYWERRSVAGLGPGAHAFDGADRRTWNTARLDRYLAALAPGDGGAPRLPPGGIDRLDPATACAEAAILGLRLSEGLDATTARISVPRTVMAWALGEGLAEWRGPRFRLTSRGRLLSNEVFARLLPADPAPEGHHPGDAPP